MDQPISSALPSQSVSGISPTVQNLILNYDEFRNGQPTAETIQGEHVPSPSNEDIKPLKSKVKEKILIPDELPTPEVTTELIKVLLDLFPPEIGMTHLKTLIGAVKFELHKILDKNGIGGKCGLGLILHKFAGDEKEKDVLIREIWKETPIPLKVNQGVARLKTIKNLLKSGYGVGDRKIKQVSSPVRHPTKTASRPLQTPIGRQGDRVTEISNISSINSCVVENAENNSLEPRAIDSIKSFPCYGAPSPVTLDVLPVTYPIVEEGVDGDMVVPSSAENAEAILHTYGFTFRLNTINQQPVVERDGIRYNDLNIALMDMRSIVARYPEVEFSKDFLRDLIPSLSTQNPHDPFCEKMLFSKQHEGDGTPHLDAFLASFDYDKEKLTEEMFYTAMTRQMVATVAVSRDPNAMCHTSVALIGQQGLTKSRRVKWLHTASEGDHSWHWAEAQVDFSQRDDRVKVCEHRTVEIAEVDGWSKKDQGAMKRFLSSTEINERRPYASFAKSIPKRCVVWITGNKEEFLADDTGARRFFPISLLNIKPIPEGLTPELIWSDVNYLYEQGYRYWYTKEEEEEWFPIKNMYQGGDNTVDMLMDKKFTVIRDANGKVNMSNWTEMDIHQIFALLELCPTDYKTYSRKIMPALRRLSGDPNYSPRKSHGSYFLLCPNPDIGVVGTEQPPSPVKWPQENGKFEYLGDRRVASASTTGGLPC